jgi:uncharacterized membrane protein YphA (DoxX/SURF4 family)
VTLRGKGLAVAGLVLRLAAAAVWLAAGAAKVPALEAFRQTVARYAVLPDFLVGPVAYALPFLEIGLGLYLALGLFVRGTALAGTVLFALFLAAQAQAWIRGIELDCGCFGTAASSPVGPLTVMRDLALGLPTFIMLAFPSRFLSLDSRLASLASAAQAPAARDRSPRGVD